MTKYRKKSVMIEAVRFEELNGHAIEKWSGGGADLMEHPQGNFYIQIVTMEGVMRADIGDWIIKGVKNELYSCKPDIFEKTYEPVESPPSE